MHGGTMNITYFFAVLYVISGCAQPLLMTLIKNAGLANASAQLYMVFYYVGPALLMIVLQCRCCVRDEPWPAWPKVLSAAGIAAFDITAQSMNYTGASLAGPTIFAIVYSSVTIWTALFSRVLLKRSLNFQQWLGVFVVFGGLAITATDSSGSGPDVVRGLILIILGSAMHALTYVMSESVMAITGGERSLTVPQNCAVQGVVACGCFCTWQLVYTWPRWDRLIMEPMSAHGATASYGIMILGVFGATNLIHALTFFHTLHKLPGGATSAGVLKGLQAVLVFLFTDWVYCGRIGGDEMCFSVSKCISLITVVGGVMLFGAGTSSSQMKSDDTEANGLSPLSVDERTPLQHA